MLRLISASLRGGFGCAGGICGKAVLFRELVLAGDTTTLMKRLSGRRKEGGCRYQCTHGIRTALC
jgi:hypothetical protein